MNVTGTHRSHGNRQNGAPAVPECPVAAGSEVVRATALAQAGRVPATPVLARMTARGVAVALNTGRTVGPDPALAPVARKVPSRLDSPPL
ncbi:hypothetical protein Scani_44340 [Streptomyces caniferus]|uniref:Uncharacterized protein n=1 Tax=Streptomyces caniferus TaxID=285557 RepID=A0A640SCC7_9ACTN|nr:hypothetical protein Scani_44340 [Streptomyces caniferus]